MRFLSSNGVLGLNARNLLYIKPFNPRRAIALADDKLRTKAYLGSRGVPVAKVFARIETRRQLRSFDFASLPDQCVLKPNAGFGGEGIVVLSGRAKNGEYLDTKRRRIGHEDMVASIEDILDGRFSISGLPDIAFFEKLLVPHECFAPFRPLGLPDLRIVVFNLVPVMAMLRVPTAESGGKANVHQGGLGIGIDLAKGITTHATQYNRLVETLPHGGSTAGHVIPRWEELLLIASRIQQLTNIGYLAVDLTIDREQGAVLLEVNARAGLMVQVANLAPLRARLTRVQGLRVGSPEKGVLLAQELFGERVRSREAPPQKPVLGLTETFHVAGDGVHIAIPCRIAAQEERSVFATDLLRELIDVGAATPASEGTYHVKGTLAGKRLQTVVTEGDVDHPLCRASIGRRDLSGFLIDPSKPASSELAATRIQDDLRATDRFLAQADRALLLLKAVKPLNLAEERAAAERDARYEPQFTYPPLAEDIDDLERKLLSLSPDESPLGTLLDRKRRDLLLRISLLRSRGDTRHFTEASQALFGSPTSVLLTAAQAQLRGREACELDSDTMDTGAAATMFEEALRFYGLEDWKVLVRPGVVADCTVGDNRIYLRAGAHFTKTHVAALLAHEIETHILTLENGKRQPFQLFRTGCAQYLDTQEGLAIHQQNRVLSPHHEKRFGPARSVLATSYALTHGFADLRRFAEETLGYSKEKALTKAIELKRGLADTGDAGAFTKALVYFRGLRAIEQFAADGGDLRRLFLGRIAIEDLALAESVPGIRAPILLPRWLRTEPQRTRK